MSFVHRGSTYIVECYEPEEPASPVQNEIVQYLPGKVADKGQAMGRRVVVRVVLRSGDLAVAVRQQVERDVLWVMESLIGGTQSKLERADYGIQVIDASELDDAGVQRLAWSLASDGDWVINPSLIYEDDVLDVSRGGKPRNQIRLSWTVVSVQEHFSVRDDAEKLARAVASKVRQVKRAQDGALGIMLVRTSYARTVAMMKPDAMVIMRAFGTLVLDPHPNLAGVFLVDRGIAKDKKPSTCGAFLCARNESALEEVFTQIRLLEDRRDVIADWGDR